MCLTNFHNRGPINPTTGGGGSIAKNQSTVSNTHHVPLISKRKLVANQLYQPARLIPEAMSEPPLLYLAG
jgi:hypothetical protein